MRREVKPFITARLDNDEEELSFDPPKQSEYQVLSRPIKHEYILKIQELHQDGMHMMDLTTGLGHVDIDTDEILLEISSPGGSIDAMFAIWGIVTKNFKYENISSEVYSQASSAGAFLFLLPRKRIIHEGASLMLHNYSIGLDGQAEAIRNALAAVDDRLKVLLDSYVKPLIPTSDYLDITKNGKDLYYDVRKSCEYGLATHVKTLDGKLMEAKHYLDFRVSPSR